VPFVSLLENTLVDINLTSKTSSKH
jgi:hypothetical protein